MNCNGWGAARLSGAPRDRPGRDDPRDVSRPAGRANHFDRMPQAHEHRSSGLCAENSTVACSRSHAVARCGAIREGVSLSRMPSLSPATSVADSTVAVAPGVPHRRASDADVLPTSLAVNRGSSAPCHREEECGRVLSGAPGFVIGSQGGDQEMGESICSGSRCSHRHAPLGSAPTRSSRSLLMHDMRGRRTHAYRHSTNQPVSHTK